MYTVGGTYIHHKAFFYIKYKLFCNTKTKSNWSGEEPSAIIDSILEDIATIYGAMNLSSSSS